jgi:2,7-dihydroxy-5-methyl-1-naphthoate 7-O-methyltransferase
VQQDVISDLDALTDLTTPWCIRVAVTLRIPELIEAGLVTAGALAAETGTNEEALSRLLRQLARKGVLLQPQPGTFTLGATGRELLDESAKLMLDLNGIGDRYARVWAGLLESVRTGASVYHKIFGLPFWQDLEKHPAVAESYDRVNGPLGHPVSTMDFDISGGWDSVETVVHLGGDIGGVLAELLLLHPHLHGILVDFPRVVAGAPEVFAAAGVADRATTAGQSFFSPLPAGADLYLIKGTMRVWSDPVAIRLLKRCAEALGPRSRLVLIDDVLPDDLGEAPPDGYEQLLTLMVGGKDARKRSLSEFRELAGTAGLAVAAASPQPRWPFVVECRLDGNGSEVSAAASAAGQPVSRA